VVLDGVHPVVADQLAAMALVPWLTTAPPLRRTPLALLPILLAL
jgi:hypothetical protein